MKLNFCMKERIRLFTTALFLFVFGLVQSQEITVSGTVSGDGDPLPGVNVIVKGTSRGVVTDFNGSYEVKVQENDVLEFSFLGFLTQEIPVSGKTKIDVVLKTDLSELEEVVVVGYGTLERKDLTGSQVSLKAEDVNKVQAVSFEEALQGKASGVQITSSSGGPGEAAKIQIRGATSINASSAPLYVIDGVEIDGDAQTISNDLGGSQSSPLSLIDPNTIDSIEILKDANATAIYGSRGANGVVIIKTKQGSKDQKITLDLDVSTGIQSISKHIDLLGAQDYVDYYNEFYPWDPSLDFTIFQQKAFRDDTGRPLPLNALKPDGTRRLITRDWRDEVFRTAHINKYSLGVRSGSSNSWFSGNVSYTDQEGIVKNSDYKRIQLSASVGANITPKLQVGINLNGGNGQRGGIVAPSRDGNGTGSQSGVITNLATAAPVQGRVDAGRQGRGANSIGFDETGFVTDLGNGRILVNPVTQVNETVSTGDELFGFASAYLDYTILDGLKFRSSISFNTYQNQGRAYYPASFGWGSIWDGLAFINSYNQTRWQNNNTLTYSKEINAHKLNVVVGTNVLKNEVKTTTLRSDNFLSDTVNLDDIGAGLNTEGDTNRLENGLLGIFGRINYTFKGRYVVSLTGRTDKSSKFFPGATQWGFFPSAGLTWNVSNEPFFDNINFLSNFRLKASAGQSGNDKIGVFLSQQTFGSSTFVANGGGIQQIDAGAVRGGNKVNGFALQRVANPNLTWETTTQYDLGAEIGLFNNRISIGADVFQKDTKDLLLNRRVSGQTGFSFILENVGEVQNRGLELTLRTVNIDKGGFKWNTNFNISFIQNEVIALGRDSQFEVTAPVGGQLASDDFIIREGAPIGSMYGFVSDGVYQYDDFVEFDGLSPAEAQQLYINGADSNPNTIRNNGDDNNNVFTPKEGVAVPQGRGLRPGQQKLRDLNGDGVIDPDNDRKIIGNANPDHFGGMTNTFKYKSWNFSFLLSWKYGNDIYNKNIIRGVSGANAFGNRFGAIRDRWTPNNRDTEQHSLRGRIFDGGISNTTNYIEDGSYLRLQNISLSYDLPKNLVYNLGLRQLRFYTAVDNLHIWTKYSGYDPDVSVGVGQNAGLTPGIDFDAYPRARTLRFGFKATF